MKILGDCFGMRWDQFFFAVYTHQDWAIGTIFGRILWPRAGLTMGTMKRENDKKIIMSGQKVFFLCFPFFHRFLVPSFLSLILARSPQRLKYRN
jgi:hypothetical protein